MKRETARAIFGFVLPIAFVANSVGWLSRVEAPFYLSLLVAAAGVGWAAIVRWRLGPPAKE